MELASDWPQFRVCRRVSMSVCVFLHLSLCRLLSLFLPCPGFLTASSNTVNKTDSLSADKKRGSCHRDRALNTKHLVWQQMWTSKEWPLRTTWTDGRLLNLCPFTCDLECLGDYVFLSPFQRLCPCAYMFLPAHMCFAAILLHSLQCLTVCIYEWWRF